MWVRGDSCVHLAVVCVHDMYVCMYVCMYITQIQIHRTDLMPRIRVFDDNFKYHFVSIFLSFLHLISNKSLLQGRAQMIHTHVHKDRTNLYLESQDFDHDSRSGLHRGSEDTQFDVSEDTKF
jgi:hypothetical protein